MPGVAYSTLFLDICQTLKYYKSSSCVCVCGAKKEKGVCLFVCVELGRKKVCACLCVWS